jgi:integrase
MRAGKLNTRKVATAKPGKYGDGGGLWLYVGPNSKSWVFRYMIRGQAHEMGLGSFDDVSLEQARELARQYRAQVHRKAEHGGPINPLHERHAAEIRQTIHQLTFRQAADDYLTANRDSWKSAKHVLQWENTLATYVHPIIGDLPIKTINRDMVVRVLQPIWHDRQETARRVRMRLQTVIDYAIARKVFHGENPATLGPIKLLLGKQTDAVQHQKALRYEQIHGFVSELRQHDGIGSEALEWLILTATRTSETLLADWSEIDFKAKEWTIPGPRRKGKKGEERPLAVPLSDRCMEILSATEKRTGRTGLIFSNQGRRLGQNILNVTIARLGHPCVGHGFRSTFRDWCGDHGVQREIAEAALGHVVPGVEGDYRRRDALALRRQLMQRWADFINQPWQDSDNIVRIGAA